MSPRKTPIVARRRPRRLSRYERAIDLLRSRSPAKSREGGWQIWQLAQSGHLDAIIYSCWRFRECRKLERAEDEAQRALARGDCFPLVEVAFDWIYGKNGWDRHCFGAPKTRGRDPKRGLRLLLRAARDGEIQAIYSLAELYANGGSFGTDQRRAVHWYRRGAALDDPDCLTTLGVRYFYGNGVRQDRARATALYRRAAALGGDSAAFNLGLQYEYGYGVPRSARLSATWMRRAVKLGSISALPKLADAYFEGRGFPRSAARGRAYLLRAQRITHAVDYRVARRTLWGDGFKLDVKGGVALLRARIREDDNRAMTTLGDWYFDVKEDYARAVVLYRRAAQLGDADAMSSLHDCLSGVPGVTKNDRVALHWLRRALALENEGAIYRMGERLLAGNGVPRNVPKGLKYMRRSMEFDTGNAWQAMGEFLLARARTGREVKKALDHFLKARSLGVDHVDDKIRECRKRLRISSR